MQRSVKSCAVSSQAIGAEGLTGGNLTNVRKMSEKTEENSMTKILKLFFKNETRPKSFERFVPFARPMKVPVPRASPSGCFRSRMAVRLPAQKKRAVTETRGSKVVSLGQRESSTRERTKIGMRPS